MLQFLVGIRLPDCTYHIPRRRITGDSICDEYSIRSGKFRSLYYMSSRSVEFNLTFTPLALVIPEFDDDHPFGDPLLLGTDGLEYTVKSELTGRGSECWLEYLTYSD